MRKNNILLGAVSLVTVVFWLLLKPVEPIATAAHISQLVGALSLVGLAYVNFIATRHPWVDRLFGGLDKAYVNHKWVSLIAIILIIAHIGILAGGEGLIIARGVINPEDGPGMLGWVSTVLFLVLGHIAFWATKMNYETWKSIHKIMFLPYLVGLAHYYQCSDYMVLGLAPFNIWLNLVNAVGLIAVIYSIFIYEKTAFRYRYNVSRVKNVAKDTIEITGNTTDKYLEFKPGQFTFLKFPDRSINFPSHPFTISQAPQKGEIQFTIKNLGDHTAKLIDKVKVGDQFAVTRPSGMFDYTRGSRHQIWIAGGIGITPFRSFLQAGVPEEFSVDLFYAYNNAAEGPYLDELKTLLGGGNVRLHLIDYREKGFLTVEMIEEAVKIENPVDIYFCGPVPMRVGLKKAMEQSNLNVLGFHFEEFKFR